MMFERQAGWLAGASHRDPGVPQVISSSAEETADLDCVLPAALAVDSELLVSDNQLKASYDDSLGKFGNR